MAKHKPGELRCPTTALIKPHTSAYFLHNLYVFTVVGQSPRSSSQPCCYSKMKMSSMIMSAVQIPPLDFVFSVLLSYSCVLVLYNLLLCQGELEVI